MNFFTISLHWSQMFYPDLPLMEIFIRGTIVYVVLFFMLRFLSRREAGALAISDLLVLVLIADAAQNAMSGQYMSITDGLLLVLTIIGWSTLINYLSYRFPLVERYVRAPQRLLVKDGQLQRKNMRRELITKDELMAALRERGLAELSAVSRAYIEPDGEVSVIAYNSGGDSGKRRKKKGV